MRLFSLFFSLKEQEASPSDTRPSEQKIKNPVKFKMRESSPPYLGEFPKCCVLSGDHQKTMIPIVIAETDLSQLLSSSTLFLLSIQRLMFSPISKATSMNTHTVRMRHTRTAFCIGLHSQMQKLLHANNICSIMASAIPCPVHGVAALYLGNSQCATAT